MFKRLQSIDEESKVSDDPKDRTNYTKKFPLERCELIVAASLKRSNVNSGRITEDNRQKFLQALGTLHRKRAKRVVYKLSPRALVTVNTKERQAESCSAAELRRGDRTVFYVPGSEVALPEEQVDFFQEVQDPDGDFRAGREPVAHTHDFKTPLNLVIADGAPERKFIRGLCERDNAKVIDAWLKNTPQRFYAIEYSWKKGEHPKRGDFSPDFFIKKGEAIFVVEIKGDEEIAEPSAENQKKYEYAVSHFERLNNWLEKAGISARYQFNFLTPNGYNKFFQKMRNGGLKGFCSELDVTLRRGSASGVTSAG